MAAVLAAGPDAVLSHLSAAALWGLRAEGTRRVDVSVAGRAGRKERPGLVVHRPRGLPPTDVTTRDGIPTTTLTRSLLDIAGTQDARVTKRLLREAEYRHRLDLGELRRSLDAHSRSRAPARLRNLLDDWVPGIGLTETELEAAFLEVCKRGGLQRPLVQHPIGRHRADFAWPRHGLVVETDGYDAHRGRIAFAEDRVKDRALIARGYTVLHFTWPEVIRHPQRIHRDVARALTPRSGVVA
jgi:very-short-patch-repair endonuclease